MGVLRLSHVDITVTDLDLACAYYTNVIGMVEVERSAGSAYLKCWDEADHHSLRLTYAPRVGFDLMSFKVERPDDLADFEDAVTRYGFPVQRISRGTSVGQGESIRFDTPSGHPMELVHDVRKVGASLPKLNPRPFVFSPPPGGGGALRAGDQPGARPPGIAPPRMDHVDDLDQAG